MPEPRKPSKACTRSSPGLDRRSKSCAETLSFALLLGCRFSCFLIRAHGRRDLLSTVLPAAIRGGNLFAIRPRAGRAEYDGRPVVVHDAPAAGLLQRSRQGSIGGKEHGVDSVLIQMPLPCVLYVDYFQVLPDELRTVEIASAVDKYLVSGIKLVDQVIAPLIRRKNAAMHVRPSHAGHRLRR